MSGLAITSKAVTRLSLAILHPATGKFFDSVLRTMLVEPGVRICVCCPIHTCEAVDFS